MKSSNFIRTIAGIQLILGIICIIILCLMGFWVSLLGIIGILLCYGILFAFADIVDYMAIIANRGDNPSISINSKKETPEPEPDEPSAMDDAYSFHTKNI